MASSGGGPVHIMSTDKLVKVHGNVLVVQLRPHDVLAVLKSKQSLNGDEAK